MELPDCLCGGDHYSGGSDLHIYAEVYYQRYDKRCCEGLGGKNAETGRTENNLPL